MRPLSSQPRRSPEFRRERIARTLLTLWLAGACSEPASPELDEPSLDAVTSDAPDATPDGAPAAHQEKAAKHEETGGHGHEAQHDEVDAKGAQRTPPVRRPPPRGNLPDFFDSADAERLDQLWTRPGITVVMARRRPFDGVIEVATDRVPDEITAERRRREFARLGFEAWPPSPRPELAPVGDPALALCPFLISDDRTGMPFDPSLDTRTGRGVIVCAQNLDELEAIVRGNIASAVAVRRAAPCRELQRVDPEANDGVGAAKERNAKGKTKQTDEAAASPPPKAKGKREPPSRHSRASLQAMRAICRDMRAMFALGYPFRTAPTED